MEKKSTKPLETFLNEELSLSFISSQIKFSMLLFFEELDHVLEVLLG